MAAIWGKNNASSGINAALGLGTNGEGIVQFDSTFHESPDFISSSSLSSSLSSSTNSSSFPSACDSLAMITLDLRHSHYPNRRWFEIRVNSRCCLSDLKKKLHLHVGTSPGCMILYLDKFSEHIDASCPCVTAVSPLIPLISEVCNLHEYGCPDAGGTIHIIDVEPRRLATDDEDLSSRYVISEEDYDKRKNSMRKFISKLRETQPELFCKRATQSDAEPRTTSALLTTSGSSGERNQLATIQEQEKKTTVQAESAICSLELCRKSFPLKARCKVEPGDRRGEIAFVGFRKSKAKTSKLLQTQANQCTYNIKGNANDTHDDQTSYQQVWIGISLDEPFGNTDGYDATSKTKIFECNGMNYGLWAKPQEVHVGDFPPIDPFDLDEI